MKRTDRSEEYISSAADILRQRKRNKNPRPMTISRMHQLNAEQNKRQGKYTSIAKGFGPGHKQNRPNGEKKEMRRERVMKKKITPRKVVD
jgi:hypothetical protein